MRSGLALLAALSLTGCSAFMTKPPHDPRPGQWIICSDSSTAPIVDTGVAAVGIVGGIGAWLAVDDRRSNDGVNVMDDKIDTTELFVKTAAVIGVITGLAYTFAAVAGYDTASRCREMKAKHPPAAPPPAPLPAPPYGASLSLTQPDSARL